MQQVIRRWINQSLLLRTPGCDSDSACSDRGQKSPPGRNDGREQRTTEIASAISFACWLGQITRILARSGANSSSRGIMIGSLRNLCSDASAGFFCARVRTIGLRTARRAQGSAACRSQRRARKPKETGTAYLRSPTPSRPNQDLPHCHQGRDWGR